MNYLKSYFSRNTKTILDDSVTNQELVNYSITNTKRVVASLTFKHHTYINGLQITKSLTVSKYKLAMHEAVNNLKLAHNLQVLDLPLSSPAPICKTVNGSCYINGMVDELARRNKSALDRLDTINTLKLRSLKLSLDKAIYLEEYIYNSNVDELDSQLISAELELENLINDIGSSYFANSFHACSWT